MKNFRRFINSKECLLAAIFALSLSNTMYSLLEIKSLMGVSSIVLIYTLFKFMFDDSIEVYKND